MIVLAPPIVALSVKSPRTRIRRSTWLLSLWGSMTMPEARPVNVAVIGVSRSVVLIPAASAKAS